MQRNHAAAGLALLLASVAVAGDASTVMRQDLASLVDRAELIFVGTVVHSEPVETKDRAFAFTYVTFEIEEVFKGSAAGSELTLRFAGADLGAEKLEVSGMPTFSRGGRHLLFVEGNGRLGCPLVGWWQGKLDFAAHPLSGEPLLLDFSGRAVEGVSGGEWRLSELRVAADGTLAAGSGAGAQVIAEDGVHIELPQAATGEERLAPTPGAGEVLASLRRFVARRAGTASFRQAPPVASASPADVPASFTFRAHPAGER